MSPSRDLRENPSKKMNTFLVIAAFMAAIAAGAVALPLLRDKQSRLIGAVAAVLVIGAAAGLYPLWSNWNWHPAPSEAAAGPETPIVLPTEAPDQVDYEGEVAIVIGREARDIDPAYGLAFDRARAAGVETLAYTCRISHGGVTLARG